MKTAISDERLWDALTWIARLPLIGDGELARLMGIDELDARYLRRELDQRGWVDKIPARSAGLDEQRDAVFLRRGALPDLAACTGIAADEIARRAPVSDADTLHRVPRIETVSAINWLLAALAAALRERGEAVLADACSLPLASRKGRWWPPDVEAYGLVRRGRSAVRFFLAWDRAGAPDLHRRARVRGWATYAQAPATIFVVCADIREQAVWEAELRRYAERATDMPDVRLTTAQEILFAGPRTAIWSSPGSAEPSRFEQALSLVSPDAMPLLTFPASMRLLARAPGMPRLREWAPGAAVLARDEPIRERVAALAVVTDAMHKRCLEWLARHPRLSAPQLAEFLGLPVSALSRRLEMLIRYHAVRRLDVGGEELWCVTARALHLLASAEGVPPRRYERDGAVSAPPPEADTVTHPSLAHELGINRVFTRFAIDARTVGLRLGVWRNEAESTHRFSHDGRNLWIRPDGSGVLVGERKSWPFLLEYDRGTLDAGDFRRKFDGLRHYYAARQWEGAWDVQPALLFVCMDSRAEERVARAARALVPKLPVLLTTEWRYESDARNAAGLLGRIWRSPSACHRARDAWPLSGSRAATAGQFDELTREE